MSSHHMIEQLRSGHAKSSIVRTCRYTGGPRRCQVSQGIAEIAIGSFQLGSEANRSDTVRHTDSVSFIRQHEDAAIRTVFGAQTATDAVIFNNDLKMFSSVNGVNRTTNHAMRVGA